VAHGETVEWFTSRRVREPVGMFKTIADAGTGRILGAHLFGHRADEVINTFALAARFGVTSRELKQAIYSYPTAVSDVPYML
jgi:glutathione reductase (NADPH)